MIVPFLVLAKLTIYWLVVMMKAVAFLADINNILAIA